MAKNKDLDEIIETLGELGFTEETEEKIEETKKTEDELSDLEEIEEALEEVAEMEEEEGLKKIYDMLGSIARELVELKLGMIKVQTCEIVSQEEIDEYYEKEFEEEVPE